MPIQLNSWFKNGSPVVMSVRSIIAIIVTLTLTYGVIAERFDWQDYKEIALIVVTYFFTVKSTEDKQKKDNAKKEESI